MHIVFTRHSGGVSVCTPSREVLARMADGLLWVGKPRYFTDEQIYLQTLAGIREEHAARFARAIAYGGVGEREAYEIICDRDCARHGRLHEIHNSEDLPRNRWFRDAWSRSHNGGPIGIDLEKAKVVHWSRLREAVNDENKLRRESFEPLRLIRPPWNTIRSAIKHARDEDELRRVWLPELSKH